MGVNWNHKSLTCAVSSSKDFLLLAIYLIRYKLLSLLSSSSFFPIILSPIKFLITVMLSTTWIWLFALLSNFYTCNYHVRDFKWQWKHTLEAVRRFFIEIKRFRFSFLIFNTSNWRRKFNVDFIISHVKIENNRKIRYKQRIWLLPRIPDCYYLKDSKVCLFIAPLEGYRCLRHFAVVRRLVRTYFIINSDTPNKILYNILFICGNVLYQGHYGNKVILY